MNQITELSPTVALQLEVVLTSEETCSVCMETMEIGDRARQLTCNHMFHSDCIADWWKMELRRKQKELVEALENDLAAPTDIHATCPLCRCVEPRAIAQDEPGEVLMEAIGHPQLSSRQDIIDASV
eukprot:Skav230227  [mRNA]  locus=scaffold4204:22046:24495:- [translate_table: standard]